MAFFALTDAGGDGIFTGPDPAADKVIKTGDALFGSTVLGLFPGTQNRFGQVAFRADLANGTTVIARSDLFNGGGQSSEVNAFLRYGKPHQTSTELAVGTVMVPVAPGRNVLLFTVQGTTSSGRIATDRDRLVFIVP